MGGLGLVKGRLRNRVVGEQVPLALEGLGGEIEIGLGRGQVRLRLFEVNEEGLPVDLEQRCAGLHPVAYLHQHPIHLARNLRRDFQGVEGPYLADQLQGGVLLAHLGSNQLDLAWRQRLLEGFGGGGRIVVGLVGITGGQREGRHDGEENQRQGCG